MIIASEISTQIGGKTILKNCSLCLIPGRFTAVVGLNGAGKSTLLKILSGNVGNYTGSISINGCPFNQYTAGSFAKVRAILPQNTAVNFPFTIEQIIEIGRYTHQTSERENKYIIEEAIRLTGLTKFKGRTYQTLSGGEQQRVQMARVICQIWDGSSDPKYLLLDEPVSSLDIAQQHSILSLAKELAGRNIGVMAVLHDLNLAVQYADEILFIKDGETVAYGPLNEVVTEKNIKDTFCHPVRIISDEGQLIIVPGACRNDKCRINDKWGKNEERNSKKSNFFNPGFRKNIKQVYTNSNK